MWQTVIWLTGRVRYYGDDIAAVVAEDEVTASRALKLIKVEYEEYPVVVSPKISMRGTEHPIHLDKKDNILARSSFAIEMWTAQWRRLPRS